MVFPVALSIVYGPFTAMKRPWTVVENETYGLLFRLVWAISISWVIFSCHNNHGGEIVCSYFFFRSNSLTIGNIVISPERGLFSDMQVVLTPFLKTLFNIIQMKFLDSILGQRS